MVERDLNGNLPPLKVKDLMPEAITVFVAVMGPIILTFIIVTWCCRSARRKRKEREALEGLEGKPIATGPNP